MKFFLLLVLCSCAMKFGGGRRKPPKVPQTKPKQEYFDALCAKGDVGYKSYIDYLLSYVSYKDYLMSKGTDFVNLPKNSCYLEQISLESLYYYPGFTKLYFAKCQFNKVVKFQEINLVIKYEGMNYKKVQRLLDGKTWLLPTDKCIFLEQKRMIPYESLKSKP